MRLQRIRKVERFESARGAGEVLQTPVGRRVDVGARDLRGADVVGPGRGLRRVVVDGDHGRARRGCAHVHVHCWGRRRSGSVRP